MSREKLADRLRALLGAPLGELGASLQSLWSGYGAIYRFTTGGQEPRSYIVKSVTPGRASRRGASDAGHLRKLSSYRVEACFYRTYAVLAPESCLVPRARHLLEGDDEWLFVLDDLDALGFDGRRGSLSLEEARSCLQFLARFHATFLGSSGEGLWQVGTYWHLDTRQEELRVMTDRRLKEAATGMDCALNGARYQTLVHGDAKVENFCFNEISGGVAAVDFQYVGRGVGMKDVAYFLSSCLSERELSQHADALLDVYFEELHSSLAALHPATPSSEVEREWRSLYPIAWGDFLRFLSGWAPGGEPLRGYEKRMVDEALALLPRSTFH